MPLYINNCSIRISDNTNSDLFTTKGETIKEIKSDTGLINTNPTVILADPFLFVCNDVLYLFYEKQKKWYGKGCICMQKTKDLITWSEEKMVLSESFHLSFPFVFENQGHYYMIPETGHDGSIRLYESVDDTFENWVLKTKLIDDGNNWVDSSLMIDRGQFYLFTTQIPKDAQYQQHLFVSDCLYGPYKEHPQSPICISNEFGRNSGSIFKYGDKWMRPTQDCSASYGENVSIFAIEEISTTKYAESLYKDKIIEREGNYKFGGHQFNYVVFNEKVVVATDYKQRNYNLIELVRRIDNTLKR